MEVGHKNIVSTIFKRCPNCSRIWRGRDQFLHSRDLCLLGYQADLDNPEFGSLLFNHFIKQCGTTIAVPVAKFTDLYSGPRFTESKFGTEECSLFCKNEKDLASCKAKCKYAYIREILQIVKNLSS